MYKSKWNMSLSFKLKFLSMFRNNIFWKKTSFSQNEPCSWTLRTIFYHIGTSLSQNEISSWHLRTVFESPFLRRGRCPLPKLLRWSGVPFAHPLKPRLNVYQYFILEMVLLLPGVRKILPLYMFFFFIIYSVVFNCANCAQNIMYECTLQCVFSNPGTDLIIA